MVRILAVQRGSCDLFHGILEDCRSGGQVVTFAHWATEEEARIGCVSVVDQIEAELASVQAVGVSNPFQRKGGR